MRTASRNYFNVASPWSHVVNSPYCFLERESWFKIETEATITGTWVVAANVLQFTWTIMILNQFAEITEVTTLTNLTNMYATAYDGTNSVELTADWAVLSWAPVWSFFTKDKVATESYSVNLSDEVRLLETRDTKKAWRPFILTAKNWVDNFIRLHFTTTDAPVNFKALILFEYRPIDGGTLEFL